MAVDLLAEIPRDIDRHLHLVFAHDRQPAMRQRPEIIAGDVDFDVVHAFAAA